MKYKHQLIITFIALINVVLHLLPGFHFEYHRDELLYFSLCNHLDFGYATTPPFVGFMAFVSKSIFGYSVFSARFFPALFSGLLVYLTAMIAKELNGNFYSQLISAIGIAGSMLLVMMYGVFTPYCFDIFFWTLIIYFIVKYVKTNIDYYLIILGIVIGFSFLNKYNVLFLLAAILIVIPFTKHRHVFSNIFFYRGLLLSLIIALPNIIWQVMHNLPVLGHMKELNETQLVNVNRIVFIIEQLIFLLPYTIIILPGVVSFLINKQYKEFRFLLSVSGVVILLFLMLSGKSLYTSGLFPFLIVVGALFVEKQISNRYLISAVVTGLIVLSILLLPLSLPVIKTEKMISYFDRFANITGADFLRKDEDGNYRKLPQINADMLGWKQITEITNKAWSLVENKKRSFIFCANYGQAGAISIIGKKYKLPEPISFSDSYRLWLPHEFKNDIDELVYVVGEDAMESGNFKDTKEFFKEMIEIGQVDNALAIEHKTRVYLFKKPKANFNEFWKSQIKGYY
ncbi:MAG TPA: hypothetical protein DEO70_06680 [Bacteroidales bacterium]|nr:MAG: hypothetical protein A2X11_08720 [Bacteroidetes bacterium GWE2_42_24]OFY31867.1 MAG: hypothetical protein A2X09_09815 [Bacteroidetes bacterium GWF2_43_11]HBZ66505.1 hypothetical protein [Bacteroidales bacterium]